MLVKSHPLLNMVQLNRSKKKLEGMQQSKEKQLLRKIVGMLQTAKMNTIHKNMS